MNIRSAERRLLTRSSLTSVVVIVMSALLLPAIGVFAVSNESVTHEMEKVTPYEFNGDVRNLPKYTLRSSSHSRPYIHPLLKIPSAKKFPVRSLELKFPSINVPLAPMPGPIQNFAGLSFSDSCTGGQCGAGWPPDPNGDVGLNHYIEAVNTAYAIYSKTTGSLLASFTEDSLWSADVSSVCNGNSQGDPIVLYDQLADRWILTHFAFALDKTNNPVTPFYECIAVSKTSDPVSGGWWLYPLRMDPGGAGQPPVDTLNDYPKFGIWPDCLYMTANGFSGNNFVGTDYSSLSRSDLESGAPLTWSLGFLDSTNDAFTMIPSNLLGISPGSLPPAGTPNYFVSETALSGFTFEVRKFTAGPNCGNGGTLSAPVSVSQAHYMPIPGDTNLVSQPGTTNTLDMIDDRLMQKVQYRNIGGNESLWVVHSVLTSSGKVAPQWAQIDVTGGAISPALVQQQIYTPDTTLHRWMSSLAVDNSGNMALGYSTSNGTAPNYPSIAYSGRLATDPLNSLSQTETQMVAGGGSQIKDSTGQFVQRWGDYTSMSMDPADDCTFWYTNQYYSSQANGNSGNWQTHIGSFKFSSCIPQTTPSEPTVLTTAITEIFATSATGGGNVISYGGATVTDRGVCWSISTGPTTTADNCTHDGVGTGKFVSSITSLTSSTLYHVRAYATNSAGTAYGSDVQFTTSGPIVPGPALPTVTTDAITSVASTTVSGGGNVISEGDASVVARGVCWSTLSNPTIANDHTSDGAGAGAFTSSITGLTLYTTYHVRAYATSSAGTAYGNDVKFSTGIRPKRPTGLIVR